MARLREISDFLKLDFATQKTLLESKISIYEKFNAPRIEFFKSGKRIVFYRKGREFGIAERILCNIFEPLIEKVNSLDLTRLQNGIKLEVCYFPNNKPAILEYERIPRDGIYVVSAFDFNSKKFKSQKYINEISQVLGFDIAKPVWEGSLDNHQRNMFRAYIGKSKKLRNFMRGLFAENFKFTLNEDVSKPIDSILINMGKYSFRFKDEFAMPLINESIKNRESLDIYGLIMSDFVEFFNEHIDLTEFNPTHETIEEDFVYIVNEITKNYLIARQDTYSDIEFDSDPLFISKNLLSEELNYVLNIPNAENVYRMIFQSMWNPRKKISGTFTENILEDLQNIRKAVSSRINIAKGDYIPTFSEYKILKGK